MRLRFGKHQGKAITILCAIWMLWVTATAYAAEWTFMVYIGGDNNLSEAAIVDIEEMRQATSSAEINVIVQVECSPYHTFNLPEYIPDFSTYRLAIINGQISTASAGGNLDMGDPATLRDFIY